jgi:hypothetical protein
MLYFGMKRLLLFALILVAGCHSSVEMSVDHHDNAAQEPKVADGGVTPMTTAPVGIAPVSGSESVAGGGSATGQLMKDKAKQVGGSSSVNQMPAEEGN